MSDMRTLLDDIRIVDADTHVIEPPDLFTSRVSTKKWGDLVPHVRWDDASQEEVWFFGDKRIYAAGLASGARWHEYPPDHPRRLADSDDRNWDRARRIEHMDAAGIHAQVLYPNIGVFQVNEYIGMQSDPALALECVRAYNDFLTDFCSYAPGRYIPLMTVPFWDLDATMHELVRAHEAGHKGIVFPARMEDFTLPPLHDPHWDPFFAAAQEMRLSINFHIGSGNIPMFGTAAGRHLSYAWTGTMLFHLNASAIASLIFGGICQRFPELQFVSVESGVGWIPFLLESMDWQFHNSGVIANHPEFELLPSEYFARQIYSCFWFENASARAAIEQLGSTRVLFETDFPHPTCLYPDGQEHLRRSLAELDERTRRLVLQDNAAKLYRIPL